MARARVKRKAVGRFVPIKLAYRLGASSTVSLSGIAEGENADPRLLSLYSKRFFPPSSSLLLFYWGLFLYLEPSLSLRY